jgi:hypothetical protein
LSASGIEDLRLALDRSRIAVAAGEVVEVPARLQTDARYLEHRSTPVHFILQAQDDPTLRVKEETRFLGPEFHR